MVLVMGWLPEWVGHFGSVHRPPVNDENSATILHLLKHLLLFLKNRHFFIFSVYLATSFYSWNNQPIAVKTANNRTNQRWLSAEIDNKRTNEKPPRFSWRSLSRAPEVASTAFKASDVTQFKRTANCREGFQERKSENKRQEQEAGRRTRCTRREEEREMSNRKPQKTYLCQMQMFNLHGASILMP